MVLGFEARLETRGGNRNLTNRERADKLLREAEAIYREISEHLKSESFNIAVRRSQEVVELVLKGLLCELGIDYPKAHNVAPIFSQAVRQKGIGVAEDFLKWLEEVSANLASKRAPAFYCEMDCSCDEAKKAMEWAGQVMTFGKELLKKLEGQ